MRELARVLRPGGTMAVTVPRCGPEAINWALSDEYHDTPGGHVRIYRRSTLERRLRSSGLVPTATTTPTACTRPTGGCAAWSVPSNDDHPAVEAYHKVLVWDIVKAPVRDPHGRPGAQPTDRQEPGGLPDQAAAAVAGRAGRQAEPAPRRAGPARAHHTDPGGGRMTTEDIRSAEMRAARGAGRPLALRRARYRPRHRGGAARTTA